MGLVTRYGVYEVWSLVRAVHWGMAPETPIQGPMQRRGLTYSPRYLRFCGPCLLWVPEHLTAPAPRPAASELNAALNAWCPCVVGSVAIHKAWPRAGQRTSGPHLLCRHMWTHILNRQMEALLGFLALHDT